MCIYIKINSEHTLNKYRTTEEFISSMKQKRSDYDCRSY